MTHYEDVLTRRAEQTSGMSFLDWWPLEHVPASSTPQAFLSEIYMPRGYKQIVVLREIDAFGNELPSRLEIYGRR